MSFGTTEIYQQYSAIINLAGIPIGAIIIALAIAYLANGIKHIPILGSFIFGCKIIRYEKQHPIQ